MRRVLMAGLCALGLSAQAGQADWRGFYTPSRPAMTETTVADDPGACVREILLAQLRYNIPGNLLLGIGLQEAGMSRDGAFTVWPWTANSEGRGRYFDSRRAAEDWVSSEIAQGRGSVDLGCMQINLDWHPDAFDSVEEGLDPAANVDYAARLLTGHYRRTGSWEEAASDYQSRSDDVGQAYLSRLQRNVATANARIDSFRALAAGTRGRTTVRRADRAEAVMPSGPAWTSWMTPPERGGRSVFSLVGTADVQPILPSLRQVNWP